MAIKNLRLLLMSTPVGPLGSGRGGGVEFTVKNIARELSQRGHRVEIVAPGGSLCEGIPLHAIGGSAQVPAQSTRRKSSISLPQDSCLAQMWDFARAHQESTDVIVNFAYDWLPLFLTRFFYKPVLHQISMGVLSRFMQELVVSLAEENPQVVSFCSESQRDTFGKEVRELGESPVLLSGVNLEEYPFSEKPKMLRAPLAWMGRISPEKGLEDALSAAKQTGYVLTIMGKVEDSAYWERLQSEFPPSCYRYLGFLKSPALQENLRECSALLMTHRWEEAFGIVAMESLACGVPVISYRRGGPTEIIQEGISGFLVEPDSIDALVKAIGQVKSLSRKDCRKEAEKRFSMKAYGDRVERWILEVQRASQPKKKLKSA